jgi:hypothetical protein
MLLLGVELPTPDCYQTQEAGTQKEDGGGLGDRGDAIATGSRAIIAIGTRTIAIGTTAIAIGTTVIAIGNTAIATGVGWSTIERPECGVVERIKVYTRNKIRTLVTTCG